ncbi:hypothetical protein [Paenimyroides ceti]
MKKVLCLIGISMLGFSCEKIPSSATNKQIEKQLITTDSSAIHQKQSAVSDTSNTTVIHTDTVEFISTENNANYLFYHLKKDHKIRTFMNRSKALSDIYRSDILEIQWKYEGEGDLNQNAILVSLKKIGDGSVSKFRKKYPKPLSYHWSGEVPYDRDFLDGIYRNVEYYLANSKNKLIQLHLQNTDAQLGYSIEEAQKEHKSYVLIGIFNRFENRENMLQWLYIDTQNQEIYEYDLPEDRLIRFK